MTFHGYEIEGDWANSNCGKTAVATRGGKKYFLKKYQNVVAPIDNGALDAKTMEHNHKLFDDFVNIRRTVNSRIRAIASAGGNIIIPTEEFIDGNQLVEASEFVEGAVPKEEMADVLATLSMDTKKLLMMTAAGALSSVHAKGIVHCDLKLQNVLLVKNPRSAYVAKLIDFDSSYPMDNMPDELVGTPDFYSPELGKYINSEDYSEENKKTVTEKTDIFSLGLIYHFYLTGAYPEPVELTEKLQNRKDKGKAIYPYVVLNSGCKLKISPAITDKNYADLIADMLSINPEERPGATEVLMRLKGARKEGRDSKEKTPAEYAPEGFEEPWEEHSIEFDTNKLKSAGFISVKNSTLGGIKGYDLYRADGNKNFMRVDMLLLMKYARKKDAKVKSAAVEASISEVFAEPWDDHSIEFDKDMLKSKGYVSSVQKMLNGVKGYEFVRSDGSRQFIRVEMIVMLKMAKRI